jgi:hypothetical protein
VNELIERHDEAARTKDLLDEITETVEDYMKGVAGRRAAVIINKSTITFLLQQLHQSSSRFRPYIDELTKRWQPFINNDGTVAASSLSSTASDTSSSTTSTPSPAADQSTTSSSPTATPLPEDDDEAAAMLRSVTFGRR